MSIRYTLRHNIPSANLAEEDVNDSSTWDLNLLRKHELAETDNHDIVYRKHDGEVVNWADAATQQANEILEEVQDLSAHVDNQAEVVLAQLEEVSTEVATLTEEAQEAEEAAQTALVQAELAITESQENVDDASESSVTAREWAIKMDGLVDNDEYSSKYYAQQAATSASNAHTSETNASTSETNAGNSATSASQSATSANNSKNLAQDWATKTSGKVDGSEYSAKYYSQQSSLAANASHNYSVSSSNSADTSRSYSQSALNSLMTAGEYARKAEQWATEMNGTVDDSEEYSAKYYATESANSATSASNSATSASNSATSAQNWATKMDGTVDGTNYSAKYYAIETQNNTTQKAVWVDSVAQMKDTDLPIGVTAITRGYSSVNDGGSAVYYIRAKTVNDVDNYNNYTLDNGNFAERIFTSSVERVLGGAIKNIKIYTTAMSLGLTYETATIHDIYNAMDINSILILAINPSASSFANYPHNSGILHIKKMATTVNGSYYTNCIFYASGSMKKWEGNFLEYTSPTTQERVVEWSGWEEVSARPIDAPKNPQRCVDEFVEVADSYYGKGISYGTTCVSLDDGTVSGFEGLAPDMNCVTFVRQVIEGIPYYKSKYYKSSNPWRYLDGYSWAMHPPKNWFDFIKWCWRNGWEIDAGINYGNLQKGDLVFWGGSVEPYAGSQAYWKSYRSITHVGIFTGRWVEDGQGGKHPEIIQSTGYRGETPIDENSGGGIKYDYIDSDTISSHSAQYLVMFIRIPLCETKAFDTNDYDRKVLGRNLIFSHYHKPDITIKGNGEDVIIDITTRNLISEIEHGGLSSGNGTEVTATNRIRTGYIPLQIIQQSSIDYLVPNGYQLYTRCCYDKDKNFIGVNANPSLEQVAYIKFMIRKTNDGDITEQEFNTVKDNTTIVFKDNYTGYEKGYGNSIKIPKETIPNGTICKRKNGVYSTSADGVRWTPLDTATQELLESVYLYDGENYVRVLNGQNVEIL